MPTKQKVSFLAYWHNHFDPKGRAHSQMKLVMIKVKQLAQLKGVLLERHIHLMRIIGLVEADFNCALKIVYSERLIKNAEDAGISADQWGGRKNRDAIACATCRRLTWDYINIRKVTAFVGAADAASCFDRVDRPYVTVVSQKKGMYE